VFKDSENLKPSKINFNKGKVLLFFPPYPAMNSEKRGERQEHWMPYPFIYLAPFLEKAGYKTVILDARVEPEWRSILHKELKDTFALGVTSFTGPDLNYAVEVSKIAKDMNNKIHVVHGGPHATSCPEDFLNEDVADFVFVGPAEFTLPKILDALYLKKEIPTDVKGVIYKVNGKIVGDKSSPPTVFDYEEPPAFHLIDIEKYRSANNIVSYFKTRGCPFKCTFCTTGVYDVGHKARDQYRREVKYLLIDKKFGGMYFRDPLFFLRTDDVMDVTQLMLSLGGGKTKKWRGQARGTFHRQYSHEQFKAMAKSGLTTVMFGVESGSQRMLDFMVKKVKREDYIESAKICAEFGITMYNSFMFAMPNENIDDLKQSISLMHELKKVSPKYISNYNSVFVPLPGTKMMRDAIERGYKPPKTLKEWANRGFSSRFEERDDINWMGPTFKEYVKIYNEEFPNYKHPYELENEGKRINPLAAPITDTEPMIAALE